jgi:hypothetical protein
MIRLVREGADRFILGGEALALVLYNWDDSRDRIDEAAKALVSKRPKSKRQKAQEPIPAEV